MIYRYEIIEIGNTSYGLMENGGMRHGIIENGNFRHVKWRMRI